MASEIKWIKIVTDIFDDEKMLMIESLPSADSIMVIWFKLLCLAGKTNNSGVFIFNERIPYTDEMLAAIFRRDIHIVRLALKTFEDFGMVEIIDNVITIPNWAKHQTLDAYEKQKERDRLKKHRKRAEQKAMIAASSGDKSGDASGDKSGDGVGDVPALEEDIEEDEDLEEDKEGKREPADEPPAAPRKSIDYESIKSMYNSVCKSLPACKVMNDARRKAIKARFNSGYTMEDFEALFVKAEASSFLKGKNERKWTANFDWLLLDSKMAKTLEGAYDDHKGEKDNGDNSSGDSEPRKRYGTYI